MNKVIKHEIKMKEPPKDTCRVGATFKVVLLLWQLQEQRANVLFINMQGLYTGPKELVEKMKYLRMGHPGLTTRKPSLF